MKGRHQQARAVQQIPAGPIPQAIEELQTEEAKGIEARRKYIAPRGSLGLPELLEARRWRFAIPDGAFKRRAMGYRVLLWQLPEWDGITFSSESRIILTDVGKSRREQSAPRGIIVSAGLEALDLLRGNGSDVGHVVYFQQLAPWRQPCDHIEGKDYHLVLVNAADVIADEDLESALREGKLRVELHRTARGDQHVYVRADGSAVLPIPVPPTAAPEY